MNIPSFQVLRRVAVLCCTVAAGSLSSSAQVDARLVAASAGPGGIMKAGAASLNVALGSVGLVTAADSAKTFPGFPGDLPNVPPNASDVLATRQAWDGVRISFPALLGRAFDADEDRLRVLAAGPETTGGGRAVLGVDQVVYLPPPGSGQPDSFEFTVVDSYGDTDTAQVRVQIFPVSPGDAFRSRLNMFGMLQLRFRGTPGAVYQIQTSTQFSVPASWVTLAEVTADSSGLISYPAPPAPVEAARYYQAVHR
jgi:hypothetical protein